MKQSEIRIMQHRMYLTLLWKKEAEGFYYPMEPPKSYFQKEKVYVELKRGGGLYSSYDVFFAKAKIILRKKKRIIKTVIIAHSKKD